jgi:hypothetical protein
VLSSTCSGQFYIHVTVFRKTYIFFIITPTRFTNFSNFILEMKLYMFRTFPLSIIRSYSLYTQQWCMAYRQLSSSRIRFVDSSKAVYKPVWRIPLLSVQWINPDDGQRNCPKYVEFHFQNKFEKLVHLFGFIIRKYFGRYSCHLQGYVIITRIQTYKCV